MSELPYTQSPVTIVAHLRSVLFFAGYMGSGMLHSIVSLIVAPILPFRLRYRFVNLWCIANLWWLRFACGVRFNIVGRENIPDGACVVMCNHQSSWETFMLQWLISPQATVLKRELLRIPFFGWGLWLLKPIAIDRSKPREALKQLTTIGCKRLHQGCSVVIYPEGTRQLPGRPGKYNAGGANLALRAGVPILPVAHNAGECWPKGHYTKLPGTITLVIGKPMVTQGKSARELTDEVETWIRAQQKDISAIERQAVERGSSS